MRYSFIQGRLIINFRLLLLGLLVSAPAFAWLAQTTKHYLGKQYDFRFSWSDVR